MIKDINSNAQVEKAASKWLQENEGFAWEGDFYFEEPGVAVLIFVATAGVTELYTLEVEYLQSNNHA